MSEVADQSAQTSMHGCPVSDSRGQVVLHAGRDAYIGVLKKLIDDGFTMCSDLTAVDYLTHAGRVLPEGIAPERFEVVVNLTSITTRDRIRVRVQVPESDPVMPTAFNLWPGTEAMEREVFDMFGISFEGHPDLTRILMPEDWEGHPLRKDYEIGLIPVQFKGSHS
ncbi:MAG: NADH-quinone oxidoreductase subunit [Actinomycetota bacterium]|jgi:NADH-quinone oxidoreductase subunit C